jgi:hypothetical protein
VVEAAESAATLPDARELIEGFRQRTMHVALADPEIQLDLGG